ncbi:MAG: family 20 glycosylhydrolase [Bacteroidetes bacterium]|nr:family 20 glycosylhydrolase [Bacteroidota bacterium]MBS1931625.1 family 20 glycosylhydrolase [Bacteroidota bacterium]
MSRSILFFIAVLVSNITFCQSNSPIAIIPQPVKVEQKTGYFSLPQNIMIQAPANPELKYAITDLQKRLSVATGKKVIVSANSSAAIIKLEINKTANIPLGNEGYTLSVTSKNITIKANKPAGVFYGLQTLMQLFPKEIERNEKASNIAWKAPCVEITDYPRFGWRGLMFDVARHFFTKQEVKAYIDQMAKYKFNLLHLHLTDDEGWRIEIKSLPKLTEIGAWNVYRVGQFGTFPPPAPSEPRNFGGFYTQDDIKDLINYAKEKFVNIMPEVDVPGHSLAAIAAYPELSCSGGVKNIGVSSGESIKDWSTHTAIYDDNLCPSNEKVYEFLDKVMTEIAALFPFEYIHVGGDETFKTFWKSSDAITALMQKENLKTYEEVQGYFEKRLEKIVESKGKKFMGWDEILEGGIGPTAAVMSWRGAHDGVVSAGATANLSGGEVAAKAGHYVVMSPTEYAYLDYMQSDRVMEPHVYASLRLSKVYSFDPMPASLNSNEQKYVLGAQGNLWTEQVYTFRQAEYMTWPRAFAIAEDTWSPKENKNWDDFVRRVEAQFARFDVEEVKYAPSMYDPDFIVSKASDGKLKIELKNEVNGLDTYYSFDNSYPDRFYPKYTQPVMVVDFATQIKVITYRGKKPIGRMISMPISELKSRIK